jgi:hypothetical protein
LLRRPLFCNSALLRQPGPFALPRSLASFQFVPTDGGDLLHRAREASPRLWSFDHLVCLG